MDVTQLLKEDHDRVRALFQKYRGGGGITGLVKRVTGSVSPRERRAAVEKVCHELEVHTRLEEEIFYPAVRELHDPELDRLLEESLREHATVKEQVSALRADAREDADRDEKVNELEQSVEHHATEEENEMFPRLQDMMPESTRTELARRIRAAKRAAMPGTRRTAASGAGARARTRARGGAAKKVAGGARKKGSAGRRRTGRAATTTATKTRKRTKRARGGRRG